MQADSRSFGFDLLYDQGPCLVVSKPGGVLTQAPPGIDSLEVRVKGFLRERRQKKTGNIYLGVPHRIDRPASGALVLAAHARAARRLSEQFESRIVQKSYLALVGGIVQGEEGTWVDWIRKIPDEARAEISWEGQAGSKLAELDFQVLARLGSVTLIQIQLKTGRTHQIRVQAASRGHPIFGDSLYLSQRDFGPETSDPRARWIALHAFRIGFQHPMTHDRVVVTAPIPDCWRAFTDHRDWPCFLGESEGPGRPPNGSP